MASVGTVIGGRFRVDQFLGFGGMGLVVAATHLELGHRVAIKFLRNEMAATPTVVERFLREARAAVHLRTEHVCRVSDVGRTDAGAPYMVMELLEGNDLGKVVATQPLPLTVAVEYVLQASVAIAEAHASGIVHRDLKPANLFVTRRPGGGPLIKVLDFGIAKALAEAGAQLTHSSSMLGSPAYISPEQLQSARDVDARTDIWALGATLYQLLSARLPFHRPNVTEMAVRIMMEPPDPLDTDPALRAVVMRCLEKAPAQRYSDVAALAADLAPFGGPSGRALAGLVAKMLRGDTATMAPTAGLAYAGTAASPDAHAATSGTHAGAMSPPGGYGGPGARSLGGHAAGAMSSPGGHAAGAMSSPGGHAAGAMSSPGGHAAGAMSSPGGHAAGAMSSPGGHAAGAMSSPGGHAAGAMSSPGAMSLGGHAVGPGATSPLGGYAGPGAMSPGGHAAMSPGGHAAGRDARSRGGSHAVGAPTATVRRRGNLGWWIGAPLVVLASAGIALMVARPGAPTPSAAAGSAAVAGSERVAVPAPANPAPAPTVPAPAAVAPAPDEGRLDLPPDPANRKAASPRTVRPKATATTPAAPATAGSAAASSSAPTPTSGRESSGTVVGSVKSTVREAKDTCLETSDTPWNTAMCWCTKKDRARAQAAYAKLSRAKRFTVRQYCAVRGIDL